MRGALQDHASGTASGRIIPADAGSTDTDITVRIYNEDHPRRCGEHCLSGLSWALIRGSSPQMRGAQGQLRVIGRQLGIIPADAGSTRH